MFLSGQAAGRARFWNPRREDWADEEVRGHQGYPEGRGVGFGLVSGERESSQPAFQGHHGSKGRGRAGCVG